LSLAVVYKAYYGIVSLEPLDGEVYDQQAFLKETEKVTNQAYIEFIK